MRKTHHSRGKGSLGSHLGGKTTKEYTKAGSALFGIKPKSNEPDNVGRKVRPAAHNAKQAGVAKRAKRTVKRLSDRMI